MKQGWVSRRKHRQKGMTLTEQAIVLAGMGLVIGAIWAVASTVWSSYQYSRVNQQVISLVQNIRNYYGQMGALCSAPGTPCATYADNTNITADLNDDTRRLIPVELRISPSDTSGTVRHALGGTLTVVSQFSGQMIRVRLNGLKRTDCTKLLMQTPAHVMELGLYGVYTPGASVLVNLPNVLNLSSGAFAFPLPFSTAWNWCVDRGSGIWVQYDFQLRN